MTAAHLIIAAGTAGILALERKAFLQAMLSRPLVAGAILGLEFGQPTEGLIIGAAFELFFLGGVSLGSAIPDNELYATVAATACACSLTNRLPLPLSAVLALAVMVSLPAAILGKYIDRLSERLNGWIIARIADRSPPYIKLRRNLYGLWMPLLASAITCLAGVFLGDKLLPWLLDDLRITMVRALSTVWAAFLLVAAACAIRAARTAHLAWYAGLAAAVAVGAQALRSILAR